MARQRKGYGQFCPVAKTAEIFAQRWTPLLVRELCFGPRRFSDIQFALPLMSRSLLARRLDELEEAGVIERAAAEPHHVYRLTAAGEALRPVVEAMSAWGQRFGQGYIGPEDLDPGGLLWGLKRQIDPARIAEPGLVVRFDLRGLPPGKARLRYWWLVLSPLEVDVCQKDPGKGVDVVISCDLAAFVDVWLGYRGLDEAKERGEIAFSGPQRLVRSLVEIFDLPALAGPKSFRFTDPKPAKQASAA